MRILDADWTEAGGQLTPSLKVKRNVVEDRNKERIAAFYDEELARWVGFVTRLVEPLLMSVIGIAIGVIVVLMYFPIFELAGSIQ